MGVPGLSGVRLICPFEVSCSLGKLRSSGGVSGRVLSSVSLSMEGVAWEYKIILCIKIKLRLNNLKEIRNEFISYWK